MKTKKQIKKSNLDIVLENNSPNEIIENFFYDGFELTKENIIKIINIVPSLQEYVDVSSEEYKEVD